MFGSQISPVIISSHYTVALRRGGGVEGTVQLLLPGILVLIGM
jgi:hypothetical protein